MTKHSTELTVLSKRVNLIHELVNLIHELVNLIHELVNLIHELVNLIHELVNLIHELVNLIHELVNLIHELVNLIHELVNLIHELVNLIHELDVFTKFLIINIFRDITMTVCVYSLYPKYYTNRPRMFKFIELLNNNNELIVRRLALYCYKTLKKEILFCTNKFHLNVYVLL